MATQMAIIKKITALLTAVTVMTAMAVAAPQAGAAVKAWEEVNSPQPAVIQLLDAEQSVDIVVRDGYIYIYSQKPVTVKLFSILGQLIHQESVTPGYHRFKPATKGIFILRADNLTKRITL